MREGERSAPIFWPISPMCVTWIFSVVSTLVLVTCSKIP